MRAIATRAATLDDTARSKLWSEMTRFSSVGMRFIGTATAGPARAAILLALAAAAFAFILARGPARAQPAQAKSWSHVRIAAEGARPPFNFFNAENVLDGFEIELGTELCRRMKVTCTFSAQEWERLIPGLRDNQFDAIMSSMEITDSRLEKIAFSKAYLRMPSAFVSARRRQIREASPEALEGRTIGVAAGSTHQSFLEERYPKSDVKVYENNEAAILDLAEGRIDVVFGEKDALTDFLKRRYEAKCCKFLADAPRDPAYFGEGFGIGLRQQDVQLKDMFDKALDDITADGTYAKIAAKYFDFDVR